MTAMSDPIIEVANLDKFYGDFHALKDVNLTVHQGEKMVICGPSGSGKSTLLRAVNGLNKVIRGACTVRCEGKWLNPETCSADDLRFLRGQNVAQTVAVSLIGPVLARGGRVAAERKTFRRPSVKTWGAKKLRPVFVSTPSLVVP